jgi:hypothetical protein
VDPEIGRRREAAQLISQSLGGNKEIERVEPSKEITVAELTRMLTVGDQDGVI